MRLAAAGGASLTAILAVPAVAEAATFTVTKTQDTSDNSGVGACATSGACSLREAIGAANVDATADTIAFASTVSGTIALDHGAPALGWPHAGEREGGRARRPGAARGRRRGRRDG